MDVVVDRAAGLDVHKRVVVATVRAPAEHGGRTSVTRTYRTFTGDLERLARWLVAERVEVAVMEATGVFWLPVWYALTEVGLSAEVVNAGHVKRVPGRKTDVQDSQWLAQLAECGLLRGSFIPPQQIRELRDLTRYRTRVIQEHTREGQRLTKVLEDAQVKLGSVVSKPLGTSARLMMRALIAGERDPEVLADLALGRLRPKTKILAEALHGRFNAHHAFLLRLILDHIEELEAHIAELDAEIDRMIAPFAAIRDLLDTIPGVAQRSAEVIIAEIGVDMSRFPTPAALASWAALCPGHHESAGKHSSGKTRRGDVWLRTALVECAWAAAHTHDTYLSAQFWRIARRRGEKRAAVAVGHSILRIAWYLITNNEPYHDLGGDYLTQRQDNRARINYHLAQLKKLGLNVQLTDAA
jgi:transposase